MRQFGLARFALTVLVSLCAVTSSARAQGMAGGAAAPLITQPINEGVLAKLAGNTRPEANAANDRGPVANTFPMEHMLLQLRHSAEQEQALVQLIDQLHDPSSPNFHGWLTPAEYGARFGSAAADLAAITGWLQGHGLQVNTVYPSSVTIDFSGTAGQVSAAFHTAIHYIDVGGVTHFANMSDPQIPAALAPAVVGIVSLHDFRPQPQVMRNPNYTSGGNYYVTPPDLETIYNINPLFSTGISGQGQTIYLIEDTNLYTNGDWTTFRSAFGLGGYTGASLNTIHPPPPSGTNNCSSPGTNSNDGEAILDAEYASVSAPNAAIVMATCADTTTFGGLIAIQNLVNGANPPAIISMSYGECETFSGAAANAAFNSIYQQGVAEGVSIFVSAGDQEASGCNRNAAATYGIGVNGWASTPYNVAVGGTDFSDTYSGTNSTYWNSTDTATFGSAISYIPEIPWNSSCASQLVAIYNGFSTTYGLSGTCNSASGLYLEDAGGSGGPSACATGSPSISGVVSGTCAGYAKPAWQSGLVGNPSDGVRDLPDVSLFSSFFPWLHSYIICWSDPSFSSSGAKPCSGAPSNWSTGFGGTSFAAPIMAGIQALVNQHTGQRWGNPNYTFYRLAKTEYGAGGSSACNSSNGNAVGASCIFYDVTLGDNDAPCTGSYNCYRPSGTYGVLSTSNSSYQPAYKTGVGWDFATGIGTVNAYNLVTNWCFGAPTACNGSLTVGNLYGKAPDFYDDGKRDILWRYTDGSVVIWEMNGGKVLANLDLGAIPIGWTIVGTGDFFGTGTTDILWRCTDASGAACATGGVVIWEMSGGQVTANVYLGVVPLGWTIAGAGDFFGTGVAAILWRCTDVTGVACADGATVIWEMSNGQATANFNLGLVSTGWTIVGMGDFNGDHKTDILWRCTDATGTACPEGAVVIWEMNGGQVLANLYLGVVPVSWTIAGTGDFFGTGTSDVLWRCTDAAGALCTNGDVVIWEISGGQPTASIDVGVVSPGWRIAGTGDFYGTGKSDVLWRYNDGTLAVWEMNGAQVVASLELGLVPVQWILVE